MEKKKPLNLLAVMMILIIGTALFKDFDSINGHFKTPFLAIVYGFAIVLSLYLLLKKDKKESAD